MRRAGDSRHTLALSHTTHLPRSVFTRGSVTEAALAGRIVRLSQDDSVTEGRSPTGLGGVARPHTLHLYRLLAGE